MNCMSTIRAFLSVSKPGIGAMVAVTAMMGYILGLKSVHIDHSHNPLLCHPVFVLQLAVTLVGIFLSGAGASALNSYLEREYDVHMQRTSDRASVVGLLSPNTILLYGIVATLSGVTLLAVLVNLLTGFLALLTAFLYVLVYTPLKRVSWLNTCVGAIPGALPPVGGVTAATGEMSATAWILFAILFLWQHPHFFAIAWIYKDDYRRAGFKMLPVVDSPDGSRTVFYTILFSILMIPVSTLPYFFGSAGLLYCLGVICAGLGMLFMGIKFSQVRSIGNARKLLYASLIYLPIVFVLVITDISFV